MQAPEDRVVCADGGFGSIMLFYRDFEEIWQFEHTDFASIMNGDPEITISRVFLFPSLANVNPDASYRAEKPGTFPVQYNYVFFGMYIYVIDV